MQLNSIQLFNFRQFYGKTPRIKFANGPKNVTVIHGYNGSGKTALLNAFTWVLYESFSKGFQLPEQLVNKRAVTEAHPGDYVETWVEIHFDHDRVSYRVIRRCQVRRTDQANLFSVVGISTVSLEFAGEDGEWKQNEAFDDVIGRIVPYDLHSYFFFDGERIEKLVAPGADERRNIGLATKKLFGIELLERAEHHLDGARKALVAELRSVGDAGTQELIDKKRRAEELLERQQNEQEELKANYAAFEEQKEVLEKRLRTLGEARKLQEKRDGLTNRQLSVRSALDEAAKDLRSTITSDAYTVFLAPAVEKYKSMIDGLRSRGELPSPIKRQFVLDLLEACQCICNRPLEGGSARKAVEGWMNRAGQADVEEEAIRISAKMSGLAECAQRFWTKVDKLQATSERSRKELERIESDLEDISDLLKSNPIEQVSDLERQLTRNKVDAVENLRNQGSVNTHTNALIRDIEKQDSAIAKVKAKEAKQAQAQEYLNAAKESIDVLKRVKARFEAHIRSSLIDRIKRRFHDISNVPYEPRMGEDYSLRLLDSSAESALPVAASQGESQILSLSFIGSIIEEAKVYQAKRDRLPGPDSSKLPLVMDSPFGSLDPAYRGKIPRMVASLANQVVLMVTGTQWRGEVEEALEEYVGASYVLVYNTTREDVEDWTIDLGGRRYDQIRQSANEFDYTEILEVASNG